MIAPGFPRVNNATMMNFLGEGLQITTDAIDNFNVEGVGNDLYDTDLIQLNIKCRLYLLEQQIL